MKKSIVVVLLVLFSIPSWSSESHKHKSGCTVCPPGPAGPTGPAGPVGPAGADGAAGAHGSDADSDGSFAAGWGVDGRFYDAKHFSLNTVFTHDVRHDNKAVFGMIHLKFGDSYESREIEKLKYLLANTQQALEGMRGELAAKQPVIVTHPTTEIPVNPIQPTPVTIRGSVK